MHRGGPWRGFDPCRSRLQSLRFVLIDGNRSKMPSAPRAAGFTTQSRFAAIALAPAHFPVGSEVQPSIDKPRLQTARSRNRTRNRKMAPLPCLPRLSSDRIFSLSCKFAFSS